MNATITSTCDAGQTELIRDDNGGLWRVVLDGADGTLAVEEVREGSAIPCDTRGGPSSILD